MKKIATLTTLSLLSSMMGTQAFASTALDKKYDTLLTKYKLTPKEEQAYCYTDSKGAIQGTNVDQQIRLASVSKLLTSLWATEVLGPTYRYETKLFIKGDQLHIQGSFDPFMSNEKMLFLISQLNTLGYTKFNKVTYDKLVQIFPDAQKHIDPYPLITRASNGKHIQTYFNTASWSKPFKTEYDRIANLAKKDRFNKSVTMSAASVEYVETNPLVSDVNNIPSDVKVLTLKSPELHKYLKETNVKSNNYSSHTIFLDLGGEKKFEQFLSDKFSLSADEIKLYNGSGLPTTIGGKRHDNYATCAIIAKLVDALDESAKRQGKEIEDIVAVPGSDAGTFRNRLNQSETKNTFVAKTGTLMHTSSLAGAMSTKNGLSFFGIFNHTSNTNSAKAVQNEMVKEIMAELGGPKNFKYTVQGFHSYDGNELLKKLGLDVEESDFSSIDGDLEVLQ